MIRAVLTLLLACNGIVAADPCVDYRDYLRQIGHAPTDDSARDVVVQDDIAYLADGDAGFTILDVGDPTQPVPLANLSTVGIALWIAVHEDHAYIANTDNELHVVDIGFPSRPRVVTVVPLPGNGQDLLVHAPFLLVAAAAEGLLVLDIGNPASPIIIGVADTPGFARGVDMDGDLAAVADDSGLAMIDLANPERPVLLGWTETIGDAFGVALDGTTALVAAGITGLEVFDVSAPASPTTVVQLLLPGVARNIQRVDDMAFIACGGLCVVDVSLPHLPSLVGRASTTDSPISVTVVDALAFVPTGDGGLDVFDADPPLSVPSLSVTGVEGVAFGVDTRGSLTVVGAENLSVFDHTDPTDPVLLGTLDFLGSTSRLTIDGDLVLVTGAGDGGGRLLIADISDPAAPSELAVLELEGFVSQMSVRGALVYLADFFFGGLFVVDLIDPTQPKLEATIPTRLYALCLDQVSDHLLVGTGAFGDAVLQIFDLADPATPTLVDEIFLPGQAIYGLAVQGDHVYATLHHGPGGELLVFDATDPAAMQQVATLPLPDELHDVVVEGDVAYITTYHGFVHVIDITDPAHPTRIGQTFLPDSAFVLALSEGAVHAAATDVGLALLPRQCDGVVAVADGVGSSGPTSSDLSSLTAYPNPFNPSVTLSFTPRRAGRVSIVVYDVAGRRVIDLFRGDLTAERHTVTWDGRDGAGRVMPSGHYLARLVGDGYAGTVRMVLAR